MPKENPENLDKARRKFRPIATSYIITGIIAIFGDGIPIFG
jgi:hypothetical protein